MPDPLPPVEFIEEIFLRAKPIDPAATSIAGFVGHCHHGPAEPTPLTSFAAFRRTFGNATDLDSPHGPTPNYLALAVQGFFANGGRKVYIARLPAGVTLDPPDSPAQPLLGLAALATIDEISIVAAPFVAALTDHAQRLAAHQALIRHAEQLRRFAILSAPLTPDLAQVRSYRAHFDSPFAALYFPWVLVSPHPASSPRPIPPDGHIAGIYARTDARRGVHKAPANENVQGIRGLAHPVTQHDQALLNPEGINCLRIFPGRGRLVYGARTLSTDPEWKYINVRRLLLFLERSIDRGTQWAVFEPNAEPLWSFMRAIIEGFLHQQWLAGALQGARPEHAYFVRCDQTTMTQNDLDNGRLIALVGVAPLRPAEFVILRIGQWTADRPG